MTFCIRAESMDKVDGSSSSKSRAGVDLLAWKFGVPAAHVILLRGFMPSHADPWIVDDLSGQSAAEP